MILAVLLAVTGRLMGIREFYEIAVATAVLLSGSMFVINRRRQRLTTTRRVVPHRIHAGNPARIEITITNQSNTTSEPIHYVEHLTAELGGLRRFGVAPVETSGRREISVEILAERRGRYRIGPAEIWFSDAFGLTRKRLDPIAPTELIVYPALEDLESSPPRLETIGGDQARSIAPAQTGGEFFAIREYQWGDDLRKIHWASTARIGKPMIRQEELLTETGTTVVVDDSITTLPPGPAGQPAFDRITSSAATVLRHFQRRGFAVGLMMGSDARAGKMPPSPAKGGEHLHSLMERLATAGPVQDADPAEALVALRTSRKSHGVIVLITCDLSVGLDSFDRAGVGHRAERILVVHPAHSFLPAASDHAALDASLQRLAGLATRRGFRVLLAPAGQPLGVAWRREFGGRLEMIAT